MAKIYVRRLYLINERIDNIIIIFRAAFFRLLVLSGELLEDKCYDDEKIYKMYSTSNAK